MDTLDFSDFLHRTLLHEFIMGRISCFEYYMKTSNVVALYGNCKESVKDVENT